MKKIALLMHFVGVAVIGAGCAAHAADCKKSGTLTLNAKVKSVDRSKWGDSLMIDKTKGSCSVDSIGLEHSAPSNCVAGSTVAATGKYLMVDMAGLTFEADKVRCR